MLQIDTLTPDQIARFPEWVEKWIAVGLSTERTNFAETEQAVLACYSVCNLPRPRVLLRMGSPYAATLGGTMAVTLLGHSQLRSPVWNQVWGQVGQVLSHLERQVRSPVRSQVWGQVGQVLSQVGEVRSQVLRQVGNQVGQVGEVRSQVWGQVGQVLSQVGGSYLNCRGGQFWASWYAFISYFRDICGWTNQSLRLFALDEALQTAGWIWWHEAVCAISDRPIRLVRDSQHRLHAADGMAIEYSDGWGLYAWHGVRVEADVIERPDFLTSERILAEPNAEVRRVMVERVGLDRFIMMAKAKPIDTDQDGRRILYKIDWKNDEPIVAVKVRCPSTDQIYFLRVPPTIRRCDQAVAWTFGYDKVTEYKPQVET